MSNSLLSIGSSALDAAYVALRTAGNNIANVNTPGYSREVVTFQPEVQTSVGSMYEGSGVMATDITRQYSSFLTQQTNLAQSGASQADTTVSLTNQINSLFSNTTTGLGNAMDSFFSQLQTLAATPGNSAAQQTAITSAQNMTGQFNDYYAQLQNMSQAADAQLQQQINTVNTTVAQIAQLNQQISVASVGGQSPNSLLDQRDLDIQNLNKSVGISTSTESNGSIDLYLSNGQPLLVGSKTYSMSMGLDPTNPSNMQVGVSNGSSITALSSSDAGGGAIAALLQFRNQTIPGVENQIGQLALNLSTQLNALQTQGVTPAGATGVNMFAAQSIGVQASTTNTDSVGLSATFSNVSQVQASNYQLQVQGSNYVVTRLSDGTKTSYSSVPISVDGMSLNFTGVTPPATGPANGDIFNISPVQTAANTFALSITQGSQIASGSPVKASLPLTNTGTLVVGSLNLSPLSSNPNNTTNPNLTQPVTLTFTGPTSYTYSVNGGAASAAQTYTPGQAISLNGWSLTMTGSPANGDSVTVQPGAATAGDNRNLLLMNQLQTQQVVNGATLDQAYSNIVGDVGTIASNAQTNQTSQDAILTQAQAAQSSVSGVNLDEEASSLMQFQQQYQAAAQLINSSTQIFNSLITVLNAA